MGRPEGAPRAPRPLGRRGGPVCRPASWNEAAPPRSARASQTLGLHVLPYGPREGAGGGQVSQKQTLPVAAPSSAMGRLHGPGWD